MYKKNKLNKTSINVNNGYIGETIEEKVRRIVINKEPISDGAPLIYTERKNGVEPQYNVRTDRFEIAVDAMTAGAKSEQAKRENKPNSLGEEAKKNMAIENGGAESTQGTGTE